MGIEGMCMAMPPRVPRNSVPAPSAAASISVQRARKGCKPVNPILNYEDMPEVSCKKKIDLDARHDVDEVFTDHGFDFQANDQVLDANSQWVCRACTYVNHNLLQQCEVCNTARCGDLQRNLKQPCETIGRTEMNSSFSQDDWPALEEASDEWLLCDVSSIASSSSWLAVACADEDIGEKLEELTILPGDRFVKADGKVKYVSWSSCVASVGSKGNGTQVPVAGVLMPPLWHKPIVRRRLKRSDAVEEGDWNLEILEERRHGSHKSHARYRHRLHKKR